MKGLSTFMMQAKPSVVLLIKSASSLWCLLNCIILISVITQSIVVASVPSELLLNRLSETSNVIMKSLHNLNPKHAADYEVGPAHSRNLEGVRSQLKSMRNSSDNVPSRLPMNRNFNIKIISQLMNQMIDSSKKTSEPYFHPGRQITSNRSAIRLHITNRRSNNNDSNKSERVTARNSTNDILTENFKSRRKLVDSENRNTEQYNEKDEFQTDKKKRKSLPVAIIIGVKKGGTRALLEFLGAHPQVATSGPEVHFFDKHYDLGLDWYRNQMPYTTEDQIAMEKTPSYFISEDSPERIYKMSPKTRLILLLRDPVTRVISDYTQALSKRPGMTALEELVLRNNSPGVINTHWGPLKIGLYAEHLARWLKYFPLSNIHIVQSELLVREPLTQLVRLESFLGLDSYFTGDMFRWRNDRGFPCLVRYRNSTDNDEGISSENKRNRRGFNSQSELKRNRSRIQCLGKNKGRLHPEISANVLERLREFYRPYNGKLYWMISQNLGWS